MFATETQHIARQQRPKSWKIHYMSCTTARYIRYVMANVAGGAGDDVPAVPPSPTQLSSSCSWTQTNSDAYVMSDGRQYFDTGITVNTANNIEVTVQVINGNNARIFGTQNSTCYYDMTISAASVPAFRMGTNTQNTAASVATAKRKTKNKWETEANGDTSKRIKFNGSNKISKSLTSHCTANNTIMIFNNDCMSVDQTLSGGIKLYSLKLYNSSGTLINNFQPVEAGTHLTNCGPNGGDYVAPTNGLWDAVTKKFYQAGGTGGQIVFGTD